MNQKTNPQQQYPQQFPQQQYFPQQQFNPQMQQQLNQQYGQQFAPQYGQQFSQYPQQQFGQQMQQQYPQQQFGQQQFPPHQQQFNQQFNTQQQFNQQQQGQQQQVNIQQFGQVNPQRQPKTCDEIMALHKQLGTTPEGAVKVTLDAIFLYMDPNTRQEGKKALEKLIIELMNRPNWEKLEYTFVTRMKNPEHHHIWRSYAVGTSPENNYAMNPANYQLNVEKSHRDNYDRQVVILRSSGADLPRPVYMKKGAQDGLFYCQAVTTLYSGIRAPIKPVGDKQIQRFI